MAFDPRLAEWTARLCTDLRSQWAGGKRVFVESYVAREPRLTEYDTALLDLLYAEFLAREQAGDVPQSEEYFGRFPRLRDELSCLFEVHAELRPPESRSSDSAAEPNLPSLDELARRLVDLDLVAEAEIRHSLAKSEAIGKPSDEPAGSLTGSTTSLLSDLQRRGKLTSFQIGRIEADRMESLRIGRYVLHAPLGSGGMGDVFLAFDTRMERFAALKQLPAATWQDVAAVQRFRQEVKAAAKLKHPNIVTAYDAGEHEGRHYLVMEYIEGRDLAAVVRADGPLPVPAALDYLLQTARGLAFAHAHGVVHRDIKPANLLVGREGLVKILDLGLARLEDRRPLVAAVRDGLTNSGHILGTVDYMAPEQAADTRDADARADIYSLGCTFYRLLTGEALYAEETVVKKLLAHRDQPIPSLRVRRADVSPAYDALFQRMVAKRPEDRQQSMQQVIDEFTAARVGAAVAPHSAAVNAVKVSRNSDEVDSAAGLVDLQPMLKHEPTQDELDTAPRSETTLSSLPRPPITLPARVPSTRMWRVVAAAAAVAAAVAGIILWFQDPEDRTAAKLESPTGGHPPPTPSAETASPTILRSATSSRDSQAIVVSAPAGVAPQRAQAPFNAAAAHVHQHDWAQFLGAKIELENDVGMELRLIPPGEFSMGTSNEEIAALVLSEKNPIGKQVVGSQGPRHRVTISRPFYVGTTEVTQAQYRSVMNGNPAAFSPRGPQSVAVVGLDTDRFPVESVSWFEAVEFCNQLSRREKLAEYYRIEQDVVSVGGGAGYRLPTEAEWEYACRAGSETPFWPGSDLSRLSDAAWLGADGHERPHPVKAKSPNPFGLFDVHGNVWEWCFDWFGPYVAQPVTDPSGPSRPDRVLSGRVMRGGGYNTSPTTARSAWRFINSPENRYPFGGFRIARNVPTGSQNSPAP